MFCRFVCLHMYVVLMLRSPPPNLKSLSRTHALPGDKNTYLEPYNGVFNVNWGWDSSFWLNTLDSRYWDRNPGRFDPDPPAVPRPRHWLGKNHHHDQWSRPSGLEHRAMKKMSCLVSLLPSRKPDICINEKINDWLTWREKNKQQTFGDSGSDILRFGCSYFRKPACLTLQRFGARTQICKTLELKKPFICMVFAILSSQDFHLAIFGRYFGARTSPFA